MKNLQLNSVLFRFPRFSSVLPPQGAVEEMYRSRIRLFRYYAAAGSSDPRENVDPRYYWAVKLS